MAKFTGFCVALILVLASASAAQRRLNSISELMTLHQNDQTNILELLFWFANQVNIDGKIIRLTFDPNSEYGSHHYGNYEGLMEYCWAGKYYTVGNVHKDISRQLPRYVVHSPRANNGWNRARIIIRVSGGNTASQNQQIIDRVIITQHYGASDDHGTNYDPDHTYEVSTSLLREFRRSNRNEIQQLAERSRRGNFGYAYNQHRHTFSANDSRATNDDNKLGEVCMTILFIIIIAILVLFFLGYMKK